MADKDNYWIVEKTKEIAKRLGANWEDLYSLISFESGWNPTIKNPYSTARGLIQFVDKTAKGLGYRDSLDLVTKAPTIAEQLPIVEKYLSQYAPFNNSKQQLYMSVFYPAYRKVSPTTLFPENVRAVNPNINTPQDYMNFVDRKAKKKVESKDNILPLVLGGLVIGYLILKK